MKELNEKEMRKIITGGFLNSTILEFIKPFVEPNFYITPDREVPGNVPSIFIDYVI